MGNFLENSVKILKLFVRVGRWYMSKYVKTKINKLNCWFLIIFLVLFYAGQTDYTDHRIIEILGLRPSNRLPVLYYINDIIYMVIAL